MPDSTRNTGYKSAREKFLGLSLESTRKSYYPQLKDQLETVQDKERRLQLLIDNVPAQISYVNSSHYYEMVNGAYEKAFNQPRERIIGSHVKSIVGETNFRKILPYILETLSGKHVHYEMEFTDSDGKIRWHEVTYVPNLDSQGTVVGFYSLTLDQTAKKRDEEERKILEQRIQEIQKFKAIGTLAGGIAHDFNNLLMGIQGRSSLINLELESGSPIREHLQAIDEYIRSAADLTKQLLGFARGGKYEVAPVDINELVLYCASMFGRTRKDIKMHHPTNTRQLVVEVDRRQIEQVLLNIFVNAWQAMPDGGEIFIDIKAISIDPVLCKAHDIADGPYVAITITDIGIGMTEDVRKRVFDPFFTTRDKQRGTGLGLASAYGIIKNHGGLITVESEVGSGATFNIFLPLSDKSPQLEVSPTENIIPGKETILLVDDEDIIIEVGRAMLTKLGYQVITADGGKAAITLVKDNEARPDLVILDMVMPGLDGGKTFDELRKIDPEIPILLSSGYSINGQAERIMQRGCNGFIQKPFNIEELSQHIRSILDTPEKT